MGHAYGWPQGILTRTFTSIIATSTYYMVTCVIYNAVLEYSIRQLCNDDEYDRVTWLLNKPPSN